MGLLRGCFLQADLDQIGALTDALIANLSLNIISKAAEFYGVGRSLCVGKVWNQQVGFGVALSLEVSLVVGLLSDSGDME